jgi:hypothetical protein
MASSANISSGDVGCQAGKVEGGAGAPSGPWESSSIGFSFLSKACEGDIIDP